MNRFKVRVWDTLGECYLPQIYRLIHGQDGFVYQADLWIDSYLRETPIFLSFTTILHCKRFIVEQCTGLADVTGIFIYDGDIVTLLGGEHRVILFRNGGFGWTAFGDEEDFIGLAGHTYFHEIMKNIKIVGNIHKKY